MISNIETPSYTAVIVEPRKHIALEYVLSNFNKGLDDKWQFLVIHGNDNKEYVEDIVSNIPSRKIELKNLNVGNYSSQEYNKLFYDKSFYDWIPTEVFLIFQTDALICLQNKHLINDFIKYDYVGAPWMNGNVGNGGLSLRRKSKMMEILEKASHLKFQDTGELWNEDAFFSEKCSSVDGLCVYKPNFQEAQKFSVETVFNNVSFGTHCGWKYTRSIEEFYKYIHCFPEVAQLLKILQQ